MQQHMHHLGLGHFLVCKITQQLLASSTGGNSNGDDGCLCWAGQKGPKPGHTKAPAKRKINNYIYVHIYTCKAFPMSCSTTTNGFVCGRPGEQELRMLVGFMLPDLEATWFDYFPGMECTCDMLLLLGPWDDTRATFGCIYLSPKPLCNKPCLKELLNPKPPPLHEQVACMVA